MKPIDLQVNILKSVDLIHVKGRENFEHSQNMHREEEAARQRREKDFQVPDNPEEEGIPHKLPEKGNAQKRREDIDQKNSRSEESGEMTESSQADKDNRSQKYYDSHLGSSIDFSG